MTARKGKRLHEARERINRDTAYDLATAIDLIKQNAAAKFDETVEIAINLGVDPRHADQMVRGVVALPHGTGRALRVAVLRRPRRS